jgi:membrane protease YdiL (CAAX protease family)
MIYFYKERLRSTCSGLGFFMFAVFGTMYVVDIVLAILAQIFGISVKDNTNLFLIMGITSLASAIIPALFYCLFSKTSLQKVVQFQKVKINKLIPMIFIGLGVGFIGDYISDILNFNFSLVGISPDLNMEYTTYTPLENLLYIFSVAVAPAVAEEFAFRGVLLGKLREYGDTFAVMVSAIMFGMFHGNIYQIPFAFVMGLAMGFIVVKTNSLLPTIIIHFINNFYSVVFTMLSKSDIMTSNQVNAIYFTLMLIIVCLAIVSAIVLSNDKKFFAIEKSSEEIITFKSKLANCFTSLGMIFILILLVGETVYTSVL